MSAADQPTGSLYIFEIAQLRERIRQLEAALEIAKVDNRQLRADGLACAKDYMACAALLVAAERRIQDLERIVQGIQQ